MAWACLLRNLLDSGLQANCVKGRNITVRLLWFVLGLTLGILVTRNLQWPLKSEALVSSEIFLNTDVNKLISIHNTDEATVKRAELVSFIWGPDGLPKDVPASVDKGIADERYKDLSNLKQIDRLNVTMQWGLTSTAYHFIPAVGNGKLLIYHGGHDGDFVVAKDLIEFFLKNGFALIALSMPLEAPNNRPVVDLERVGKIQLAFHEQLKLLKMKAGHPVQLFLTPVAACLNYAKPLGYNSVYMAGLSGGGWTTTIYAALDPRIIRSYPVAGTLPLHLRKDGKRSNTAQRGVDWGDYEQSIPELYTIANYLELYVLSSSGDGRKQLQILNKNDPCCMGGEDFRSYESVVNERVRASGNGSFAVYLDTKNTNHSISNTALDVIINDINNN